MQMVFDAEHVVVSFLVGHEIFRMLACSNSEQFHAWAGYPSDPSVGILFATSS